MKQDNNLSIQQGIEARIEQFIEARPALLVWLKGYTVEGNVVRVANYHHQNELRDNEHWRAAFPDVKLRNAVGPTLLTIDAVNKLKNEIVNILGDRQGPRFVNQFTFKENQIIAPNEEAARVLKLAQTAINRVYGFQVPVVVPYLLQSPPAKTPKKSKKKASTPAKPRIKREKLIFMRGDQLALWHEYFFIPHAFLRGALFSPLSVKSSEDRVTVYKEVIPVWGDYEITYSGKILLQKDLDVWEAIVESAAKRAPYTKLYFTKEELLKVMGKKKGTNNYNNLLESLEVMSSCTIDIKCPDYEYRNQRLVEGFRIDSETGDLVFRPSIEFLELFSENRWTKIQKEVRKAIGNKPLALWLHAFYESHKPPNEIKYETLYKYAYMECFRENMQLKHFKQKLKKAIEDLNSVQKEWKLQLKGRIVYYDALKKV